MNRAECISVLLWDSLLGCTPWAWPSLDRASPQPFDSTRSGAHRQEDRCIRWKERLAYNCSGRLDVRSSAHSTVCQRRRLMHSIDRTVLQGRSTCAATGARRRHHARDARMQGRTDQGTVWLRPSVSVVRDHCSPRGNRAFSRARPCTAGDVQPGLARSTNRSRQTVGWRAQAGLRSVDDDGHDDSVGVVRRRTGLTRTRSVVLTVTSHDCTERLATSSFGGETAGARSNARVNEGSRATVGGCRDSSAVDVVSTLGMLPLRSPLSAG
jgi:hypothetical protein